jgi:hypothetical protein
MKSMPDGRVLPTSGDQVYLDAGLERVRVVIGKAPCAMSASRWARYGIREGPHFSGCYRVKTDQGSTAIITWDQSSECFSPCR